MDKGTPFNRCHVTSNSLGENVELSLRIGPPAGKPLGKGDVAFNSLFRKSIRIT